jgi:hypothetical protein
MHSRRGGETRQVHHVNNDTPIPNRQSHAGKRFILYCAGGTTSIMRVEQHRAMRRPFAAKAEVVEVESEKQVLCVTGDLSVFGCFVETLTPLPRGTKVRIRINHRGATFVALGFISNVRSTGMGIRFGTVEPAHQQTLENWLGQLRTSS